MGLIEYGKFQKRGQGVNSGTKDGDWLNQRKTSCRG